MIKTVFKCVLLTLLAGTTFAYGQSEYRGKKILHLASYHIGFAWTDAIESEMRRVATQKGINYKVFYMDTKNRSSELEKTNSALRAKAFIEEFKPDVVITSDDDAAKYLLLPFYRDAALPFVFCGVNWDASVYDLPYKNATGMVEVDLVHKVAEQLQSYSKGKRFGLLSVDDLTERKNVDAYANILKVKLDKIYLVKTMEQWQQSFLNLQKEVDAMILVNNSAIVGWNDDVAIRFIEKNVRIPIGANASWMMPFAMLGLTKVSEEQGEWAIAAALKILDGTKPSEIPVVRNKNGKLYVNMRMANVINLTFNKGLLKNAEFVK